ncbi:MAG: NADH-quinone oxidoreductase subunit L [Bacteroidota bacterium]
MEETFVRLILLLPLFGAAVNGMMGLFAPAYRKQEAVIGVLGTLAVAVPFGLAVVLFLGHHHDPVIVETYTWMAAGDLVISFDYRIDALSLLMTLIVTGIGSLIHLYSAGYMHDDPGYWRFFAYLNLFIFAMLNLVLAENLLVLFLGWEGVGLCSYLLIGFWYTDLKNSAAANKAFIVNRVGDFTFLLAMFLLFRAMTTAGVAPFGLDFTTIFENAEVLTSGTVSVIVLLLFLGATGKSAQIPLFVWLPDAMAGPTPVSALIHAATMVTSGLYLLARLSPVVLEAPGVMIVIAFVGAATAIMAATVAITQNDIKKVLAYSTVSQLGYMFVAAGVGAFFVAIFHVMTHAFFKACLFLGSGSVIHSMHHVEHELEHKGVIPGHHGGHGGDASHGHGAHGAHGGAHGAKPYAALPYDGPFDAQDMRTMGGLRKYMPFTAITFLISTLAIAGIPPLAGFFSKDEILFKAFELGYDGHVWAYAVWGIGIITAVLTAVYMTRCYVLTFEGRERWPDAMDTKPHESPWTMTTPLVILAFFAMVAGFFGLPPVLGESWIHHWLGADYGGPVAEYHAELHVSHAVEWGLLGLGTLIAAGGVSFAWLNYRKSGLETDRTVRRRLGAVYTLLSNKYFVDEAYDATIVSPITEASRKGLAPFDQNVVDGTVNGAAKAIRNLSGWWRGMQTGIVQNYALALVLGVVVVVALMIFV